MQSMSIVPFLLVVLAGFAGMSGHWLKKKHRKELKGSFFDYIFADYPGRTFSTVTMLLGAAFTASSTGLLDGLDAGQAIAMLRQWQLHIPTVNSLVEAFMLGWMLDSGINKGA